MKARREQRFLFCCRGSAQDGLGHVIRTRAVIDCLPPGTEAELVVLGQDECAAPLLDGLTVPWSFAVSDQVVAERASALDPGIVMLDTMTLDRSVFEQVSARRVTASLSPIFDRLEQVDLAFSRTRYAQDGSVPTMANRRQALEYAVVRRDCRRIETRLFGRNLAESPMAIAISMGGADAPNRTLAVLEALRDVAAPATFWVLLGEGYAHSYNRLVEAVKRDDRHEVILAKTNQSMWRILRNCSLAILAGGVTTYEAAYAGLPSINLLDTGSHSFLVQELVERGAALISSTDGAALRAEVDRLERDRESLLEMHQSCQQLIDGRGTERVLAEVMRHASQRFGLLAA